MVGPSRTEVEQRPTGVRLLAGVAVLVALSGGLMALYADAPPGVVLAVTVAGGPIGVGLAWYLRRISVSGN